MSQSRCPDGHDSDWDDYCSVCGVAILSPPGTDPTATSSSAPSPGADPTAEGSSPTAAGAPDGGRCANCGAAHRPEDVFCESCGLDFASGTLPGATSEPSGDASSAPAASSAAPGQVRVGIDSVWFEQAVGAGELSLPQPVPDTVTVALPGQKALVGRHSQSRGVFPEVDVAKLTGDPAVSTRHALIERVEPDGWTITDVGSTNGTKVGEELGSAQTLKTGVPVPFGPGTSAWLGAWTRIDFGP